MKARSVSEPRKPIDPAVLCKRIEAAMAKLQRAVMMAMRHQVISKSQGLPLYTQLCEIDCALGAAFPSRTDQSDSMARLPF